MFESSEASGPAFRSASSATLCAGDSKSELVREPGDEWDDVDSDGIPWEISGPDDPQVRVQMLAWQLEWEYERLVAAADPAADLAAAIAALDGPPGPELAIAVAACRAQVGVLDGAAREALIGAAARLVNWASGVQARTIGLMATAPDPTVSFFGRDVTIGPALDETIDVVACVLHVSKHSASSRVMAAYAMTTEVPDLLDALERGVIDTWRAQIILEGITGLGEHPDIALRVATDALAYAAGGATAPALRKRVKKLLHDAAPDLVAARRKARLKHERGVRVFDEGDGISTLRWTDSTEVVQTGMAVIHGLARHKSDPCGDVPDGGDSEAGGATDASGAGEFTDAGEGGGVVAPKSCGEWGVSAGMGQNWRAGSNARTIHERMADVTADLLGHAFHTLSLPKVQGRDPRLQVSIDLHTLLDITAGGGELTGYGPIPADLAKAIAATAGTLRLKVTDPETGACLHLGKAHTYRPPQDLRDQVHAAQPHCRFPGCRRDAQQCDLDHVVNHPHGPTCLCNLVPLCRRHHRAKTSRRWSAAMLTRDDPTGTIVWTSPHGRTHHDHPEDHVAPSSVRGPDRDELGPPPF